MEQGSALAQQKLSRNKRSLAIISVLMTVILVAGVGLFLIKRDQNRKLELEQITSAEAAISHLYASKDEKELAYMSDDSLIKSAKERAALVTDKEKGALLTQRIKAAENMYSDQVKAITLINSLFSRKVPKKELLQSDINVSTQQLNKVTNKEWHKELGDKLAIVVGELEARKKAGDAVTAIEVAQKTKWDESLAVAADNAIALVKNGEVKAALAERMTAIRAAEAEKQNEIAANSQRKKQRGSQGSSGSKESGGSSKKDPMAGMPVYTYYKCSCCSFFPDMASLQRHIRNATDPSSTDYDPSSPHHFVGTFTEPYQVFHKQHN